jgi:hypothetical protein
MLIVDLNPRNAAILNEALSSDRMHSLIDAISEFNPIMWTWVNAFGRPQFQVFDMRDVPEELERQFLQLVPIGAKCGRCPCELSEKHPKEDWGADR